MLTPPKTPQDAKYGNVEDKKVLLENQEVSKHDTVALDTSLTLEGGVNQSQDVSKDKMKLPGLVSELNKKTGRPRMTAGYRRRKRKGDNS